MLIPFSEYPVRPLIEQGESLAGYFYRFYSGNGYRISLTVHKVLRNLYEGGGGSRAEAAFNHIQSLLGSAVELDKAWWCKSRCLTVPGWRQKQRIWLTLTRTQLHFCPACLNEWGLYFGLWELSLIKACPIHQCDLLTQCADCQKHFSWSDLLPEWQCSCGTPITLMPVKRASSSKVKMAKLLASANDVELHTSFQSQLIGMTKTPYLLIDVYVGLRWIIEFRVLIKKNYFGCYRYSLIKKASVIVWTEPRFWAASLLADSHHQRVNLLFRLLRKQFNKIPTMLYFVKDSDNLNWVMRYIKDAGSNLFQQKICKAVDHLQRQYRLKLPIQSIVLYNPSISIEQRVEMQTRLVNRWQVLSSYIGDLDPKIQSYQRNTSWLTGFDSPSRNREIVFLLNVLLNVTQQPFELDDFQALLYWWRIPKTLRDLRNSNDVVEQIGTYLADIPDYELSFVSSLVQLDLQGTPS
jgi:hypothetical protein